VTVQTAGPQLRLVVDNAGERLAPDQKQRLLPENILRATAFQTRESVVTVPSLLIDDFGTRKLPHTAAEDLLEISMRRYERFSTLLTSNRPAEDWGKLLGDVAAVSAMLDRLLHHGHVLKCGPRSWRTKPAAAGRE
jgi:DNA replication protein DnaC